MYESEVKNLMTAQVNEQVWVHARMYRYPWPCHLWFVAVVATQRIPRLLLHMVEAIAIITVKVDVDPIRVIIVLTRVTSEKLTRRKDHADNRPLQHFQYLELYLNNHKGKLTSLTEVGQLMKSVCACQRYWSHSYCTGVHHTYHGVLQKQHHQAPGHP